MNDRDILAAVGTGKREFGLSCGKYSGALTVELIRRAMKEQGVSVSPRDVFINGVPIEIDLLVPCRNAKLSNGLLYRPAEVLAVIEIKNAGSFGDKTIETVRKNFDRIKQASSTIRCCYLTLAERKGFTWAVTSSNSGGSAYTLFWHSGSGKNLKYEATGDWDRFLTDMRGLQEEDAQRTIGCDL